MYPIYNRLVCSEFLPKEMFNAALLQSFLGRRNDSHSMHCYRCIYGQSVVAMKHYLSTPYCSTYLALELRIEGTSVVGLLESSS
jgi:hypothetical protein